MVKNIAFYSDQVRQGKVIVFPTDTIWGIGCDATNLSAVKYVYEVKKRDLNKPCILLIDSIQNLKKYVSNLHPRIENLLIHYKKPISIIYKASDLLHPQILNHDGTVAIRVTNNPFCKELIQNLGRPVISTSANVQGEPFPKSFEDISKEIIEGADIVVDKIYDSGINEEPSMLLSFNDEGELKFIRS